MYSKLNVKLIFKECPHSFNNNSINFMDKICLKNCHKKRRKKFESFSGFRIFRNHSISFLELIFGKLLSN